MNLRFKTISRVDHHIHGIRVIRSTTVILISHWCAKAVSQ